MAVAAMLTACNSNSGRVNYTVDDDAYIEAVDSTGMIDVYAYEGTVKGRGNEPAAHYMVVISEQLDSINGTYTMTTTYVVADTLKNASHQSKGRKHTHWGLPGHKNAKVYALAPDSGATDSVFLYVESDTTVIMLDKNKRHPKHPDHFRLWLKKEANKMHHHHKHGQHKY